MTGMNKTVWTDVFLTVQLLQLSIISCQFSSLHSYQSTVLIHLATDSQMTPKMLPQNLHEQSHCIATPRRLL